MLTIRATRGFLYKEICIKQSVTLKPFQSACCQLRNYSSGKDHYDLIVIGGGSGGLACAKEAASFGKRVAVLDYVDPSPKGTTWGLGGTCVNVGCVPKKLFHLAALSRRSVTDAGKYGWKVPTEISHDWTVLAQGVQDYVRSLNWGYRVQLKDKSVDYFNAKGCLIDKHSVEATNKAGKKRTFSAENIVLATGTRPRFPSQIKGATEHAISSDDIFWLNKAPGKTLVVGASYVGLECGGFLTGLGYDTTLMVRSIPLRGFDQQMAKLVLDAVKDHGTKVVEGAVPSKIEKLPSGLLRVTGTDNNIAGEFDTVLLAIGRDPLTRQLGLDKVGVEVDKEGYVVGGHGGDHERSSVSHIYAIGDILKGRPQLTPVAIHAGKILARRLFGDHKEQMDYDKIATTVFTPMEYGCVGLTEEDAIQKLGEDGIEVYHAFYKPIEFAITHHSAEQCYVKAITERNSPRTVLGLHFLGNNAGEVIQGFAAALKCGLTYDKLQGTIGIHPTSAEEVVKLNITKRSGADPTVTAC